MNADQRGAVAPRVDPDSAGWWEALAGGRLAVPVCSSCGRTWFPPAPSCPHCGFPSNGSLRDTAGRGRIYSWIVVHRAYDPAFKEDVPYTIVVVDLDDGPRIIGRLFDVKHDDVKADLPVQARRYEVSGQPLLGFGPAPAR
jgi:uncharacterized OB-fold protein